MYHNVLNPTEKFKTYRPMFPLSVNQPWPPVITCWQNSTSSKPNCTLHWALLSNAKHMKGNSSSISREWLCTYCNSPLQNNLIQTYSTSISLETLTLTTRIFDHQIFCQWEVNFCPAPVVKLQSAKNEPTIIWLILLLWAWYNQVLPPGNSHMLAL